MLCSKYASSGADVTLFEVADDIGTKLHIGKLYYFDENSADKIFASSLAVDLRDVELVFPQYVQLEQSRSIDFAVWIVRKPKNQTSYLAPNVAVLERVESVKSVATPSIANFQVPKTPPNVASSNLEMVDCPKCNSRVRSDRLEKHIRKVHGSRPIYRNSVSYSYASSSSSSYGRNRCRHCGRPAISGDDTCYGCNPK
jgi:DNA-directed RNA polymerase subunit RPC12/RpoP